MEVVTQDRGLKKLKIRFNSSTIGLVVRNMQDPGNRALPNQQHTDCILSTGEPIGFFSSNSVKGDGSFGAYSDKFSIPDGGAILGFKEMDQYNYLLVSGFNAMQREFRSGLVIIESDVGNDERFGKFNWFLTGEKEGKINKAMSYRRFRNNCATFAHHAFDAAGIVEGEMSYMFDSPYKLFHHLIKCAKEKGYKVTCLFGFVGFETKEGDRGSRSISSNYDVTVFNYKFFNV